MNLVGWGYQLSVQHRGIDAQHELIFKLVGEIHDLWRRSAPIEGLCAAVDKTRSVLEDHFRYEERLLAETSYPDLEKHAGEHRMMLAELETIRGRLTGQGKTPPEPGWVLLNFIFGVTIGHILSTDVGYCPYLEEAQEAREG